MFSPHRNFINRLLTTFFLIAFMVSCTPTSSSSGSSGGSGGAPPAAGTAVQLKSGLDAGIEGSGTGSQDDPFIILIDESVSLKTPSVEIANLFSNVESVAARTDSSTLLNVAGKTVATKLGSKLSIELSDASGEKKYAELYFQNSARLTDAVQREEAVLLPQDRGLIAKGGSSNADSVTVTLYKKSKDEFGSVKPLLLFDYDSNNFTVTAYKDGDGDGQFSDTEKINPADEVTAAATIRLVFTPKEGVDKLLFPERSQILKIVPNNNKQISSLAFSDQAQWTGDNSGESSTEARVLNWVWNKALDLSFYVQASGEKISVRVLEENQVTATLDSLQATFDNVSNASASAIFEFSTPESETIFGKKLYVKVNLTLPASTIDKADTLANLTVTDAGNPGDGSEANPYAFNVTKDQGLGSLSALVKDNTGDLTFALKKGEPNTEFIPLTDSSLSVSSGELAAGNLTAGVWILRISDAGSTDYAAKDLYFQLTFPLGSSSLGLVEDYDDGGDGSLEDPVEVPVPTDGITLANLTTAASTGKTLTYEVVTAGSGLTTETTIDVSTNPSLKIDDRVGSATISRGSFVLKVSEDADDYREAVAFYFKLTFETESGKLKPNIIYANQGDGKDAPIEVPEIAEGASLTLSDLIASDDGTVEYFLEREGEDPIPLSSDTPLKLGENFGQSSGVLIDGDTSWTIKVTDTLDEESEPLYFKVKFTKNASSLVKNSDYSTDSGTGISTDPYVSTVAAGATLTLADLTTGKSAAGTLSYTVDGTATTATSLKVGVDSFTAGTKTIVVSDTGDVNTAAGSVHFSIDFTKNASSLVKDSDYSTDSGTGISTDPYVSTVAAGATLILADLTTGKSAAGTLSYTVDGTATTATSLKVGVDSFTAGTKTIVVSDTGDVNTAAGSVHFSIDFTKNASSLVKDSDYSTDSGTGISTDPYVSTVAAGATLILADLTTGKSAAGTLSYTVDGTGTTETSLKVGEVFTGTTKLSPGVKTITVNDPGDDFTEAGTTIYFKVTFVKNSSTFQKSDSYTTTAGDGTSDSAYESTVAADAPLTLADLTSGQSSGDLSYTVDGETPTTTSLKVGEVFTGTTKLSPGDKTIIVNDPGDAYTEAGTTIFFKVSFTKNTSSLVKKSDYSATGSGTEDAPYESTVAADASLTLADLTSGQSSGDLTYTVDNTTATVASLKVGEPLVAEGAALTAGEKTIVVNDPGDAFTAGKLITFKVTFVKNTSSLVKKSDYDTDSGTGISTDPYVSTVAADASLILANLTSGQSSGDLTYTVDDTETTKTSLKTGDIFAGTTRLGIGEHLIIIKDSGDDFTAAGTITFKVTFAKNSSTFQKSDSYSATGSGTEDAPYESTVAADASLILANLTSGQSSGDLTYTVDNTTATVASLKVGEPLAESTDLTAGEKTIVVTDNGDDFTKIGTITFKITFSLGSSSLALADDYDDGGEGSLEEPVVVTVPTTGITLANLTTVASTGKSLKYEVVDAGSSGLALESISNTSLKIGDTVGEVTLARSSFVLEVSEEEDLYREAAAFYFKLIFETASTGLRAHADYSNQSDKGSANDPIIVPDIASNASLTLANLIASYDGTVTYALSRTGVNESDLDSEVKSLSIGQDPIDHIGPWTIKVTGTLDEESEPLYFEVTFAKSQMSKAASTGTVNIGEQSGDSENVIEVRNVRGDDIVAFATDDTLNLSSLVTNFSAADNVSYQVGDDAITGAGIMSYAISNGADINLTIADSATSSTTHAPKTLHFKIIVQRQASNFALQSSLPNSRQASGNGTSYADPFVIRGTFPGNTAVDLTTFVDEDSASAAENLKYTTVTSATDTTGTRITDPTAALNKRAATSVVVRVVDAGSDTVAAKTIFLQLAFTKAASKFALKSPLPNSRQASGNGTSYDDPFVINGTFPGNRAVNLKTLVDEDSASAAKNLKYTTVTSANDEDGTPIADATSALNNRVVTSVVVRVEDKGSNTVEAKTIFLQLVFTKAASKFALKSPLPNNRTASGNGEAYATPFVISGTFTANTAVNLKTLVDEDSASAANKLTYTTVTSADDTTGNSISTPAAALSDQVGKAVVVRVKDEGSETVAGKTIFLQLIFAAAIPAADARYNPALRRGGPEIRLNGSMTAGEISFRVELLPGRYHASNNDDIVIYSVNIGFNHEFTIFYNSDGLKLYSANINPAGVIDLRKNFLAGTYDFTLRKTPSANGYKVTILVDDLTLKDNTVEITSSFDAFLNPMIGADVRDDMRRPVKAVGRVKWDFQPFVSVSRLGGNGFKRLTNDSTVGSTFFVRVPGFAAGESFELFSVTGSAAPMSLGTKTVGAGETSLEFKIDDGINGTSYEFLVREDGSNESLSDLPRSVKVTVDTSVRETTAAFTGLNDVAAVQDSSANLQKLTVTPPDGGFKVGDKIYLYELNSSSEKVAIGDTALLYEVTDDNTDAQTLSLSEIPFENKGYQLVVEVVTASGNKADSNFTIAAGEADKIFDVTFDSTPPQLSFNFSDASNLVISAHEALAQGRATNIENGLTFTGTNSDPTVSSVTYDSGSYNIQLSGMVSEGAVLNLAAGAVTDVAGNGNLAVRQNVLPNLLSIVASSDRIGGSSTSTNLTFNFAQEIDASTFNPADDLEIVAASGSVSGLSFGSVAPNMGASQTINVTLNAPSGFDNQVRVKMKDGNEISLPRTSLAAAVTGESELIDIDLKAPTPTLSFAATQVAPEKTIQFTLSFDEAVAGNIAATNFTAAAGGSVTNISRKDDRTFTGTLTAPNAETTAYSLILKADVVADAYGNNNIASTAATVNVVSNAVPVPSFSAPSLARHGGSTTLTISFPETVTGFEKGDLSVTNGVSLGDEETLSKAGNDYTVTLSTQSTWVSGAVTVTVAANAYQNSSNAGNSPALSYTIPVSHALTTPTLVSATDDTTTVAASSATEALPLSSISVKVNVSAVAGDTLLLFLGEQRVATQVIETTGTQQEIDITDPSSKVNGSRLAYHVRLQDAQGNLSESSRLLYVTFADPNAATAPQISGPVTNVSFTDDFSSDATSWSLKSASNRSGQSWSALVRDGELVLTDPGPDQYALATQNDLIFSTQGKVVFEATFIFGNKVNPADGMAFFTYDARDELFYSGRTYKGGNTLGIVGEEKRLRSLFFAIGLDEYQVDEFKYASPGTSPANLSNLGSPTGGNTSSWDPSNSNIAWSDARHRLRITVENRSVLVEHANVDVNGVVDEDSWNTILEKTFAAEAYIPDNIKIGFSATTGGENNYHAIDDVNVDAELFVPYTVGTNPVQAAPRGITLTAGKQADNSLAISRINVQISSGYQAADSLTFSGDSTLFAPTLAGETLSISAAAGQSPTTAQFLAALNAINFSTTAEGERTLSWQVFADDSGSEIPSQSYNSEIRVSSAN